MELILERIKSVQYRESTKKMYLMVWQKFSEFVMKLDDRPPTWEGRACLFGAHLFEQGIQSQTLKSYFSAIKATLQDDGYPWNSEKVVLGTLTKACRLVNDTFVPRFAICKNLLEMILFELERIYSNQPFLECLYQTILLVAYYGMFRVGEIASGTHPVKAKDVHIAKNKNKILFVLYSSKTHNKGMKPQKIKISSLNPNDHRIRYFCPFEASREYLAIRGNYVSDCDPFFVLRDNSPVLPAQLRSVLRKALSAMNINPSVYNFHSLRIGRATDMFQFGHTIEEIKIVGRWKSNAVYNYIRASVNDMH